MTKRIFSLVLALCMVLSMVPAFAAGTGYDGDKCPTHDVAWVYKMHHATDLQATSHMLGCPLCDNYKNGSTEAHKPVYVNVPSNTAEHRVDCGLCGQQGYTMEAHDFQWNATGTAKVCKCGQIADTSACEHDFTDDTNVVYNGDNTHSVKCKNCGAPDTSAVVKCEFERVNGYAANRTCKTCGGVEVCEHDYQWRVSKTNAAQCLKDCTKCGRREVNVQAHEDKYVLDPKDSYDADDNADTHLHICKNCGTQTNMWYCTSTKTVYEHDTENHWKECDYCEGGRAEIASHQLTWSNFNVKDEDGNVTGQIFAYGCWQCGYIVTECDDHKGTGLNAATCVKPEYCDKCGQVVSGTIPHSYEPAVKYDAAQHAPKCTVCGAWNTAKLANHTWVLKDGKSVCSECDAINDTDCKHTNVEEVNGWNAVCYDAETKAPKAGKKSYKKCLDCETMLYEGDEIVDPEKAHKLVKTVQVAPSCTTTGKTLVECSIPGCTHVAWEYVEITDAAAHAAYDLVFVKTVKKATCTEDGLEQWKCSNCKKVLDIKVKATGHDYTTKICDKDAAGNWTDKLNCEGGVYSYTGCKNCSRMLSTPTLIADSVKAKHLESAPVKVAATCTSIECWKIECRNDYCDYFWYEDAAGAVVNPTIAGKYHDVSKGVIEHVIKEATCDENGEMWYECPTCHAQIAAEQKDGEASAPRHWVTTTQNHTIRALGHTNKKSQVNASDEHTVAHHTVKGWNYVEATCQTLGYWESYCANCLANYIKIEDEKCIGQHEPILGKALDKEVCLKESKYEVICKHCGQPTENANGDTEELKVVEHDYVPNGAPITPNSCSKDGYGALICTRCGDETYGVIEKTDDCEFDYIFVAPTCEEPAKQGWFCVKCGVEKNPGDAVDAEDSKPLGHKMDNGEIIKLCGYEGAVIKFTCLRGCGKVVYHDSESNKEITEAELAAITHGEKGQKEIIKQTCTVDGLVKNDVCVKCGYEFALTGDNTRYEVVEAAHTKPAGTETKTDCVETFYEYKCEKCNVTVYEFVNETKDEDNHRKLTYDFTPVGCTPNSCTEDGFGFATCVACGWKAEEAEVVKPAHKFGKTPVVTIEPTCGTVGYGKFICEVCGAEKLNDDKTLYLAEIKATGKHNFVKSILDSNFCELPSYVVFECSVCGDKADEKTLKKYGYEYLTGADAVTSFTYYDVDNAPTTITAADDKSLNHIIDTVGYNGTHQYGTAVYMEATCTHGAGMIRTCKRCGHMDNLNGTAPLAHDPVETYVASTCYTNGLYMETCYNCGVVLTKEVLKTESHKMVKDEDDLRNKAATCGNTGIEVQVCENEGCGYEQLIVLNYNDNNHEWKTLREYWAADCKTGDYGYAQQQCVLCGKISVNSIAPEHTWADVEVVKAATCAEEGQKKQVCTVCEKATQIVPIERLAHTLETFAQEADCLKPAGIVTQCSVCKLETNFLKTGSEALGHKWSTKSHYEATCEKAGGEKIVCLREGCGASYVFEDADKYPALAHKGKTLVETKAATCQSPMIKVYFCPICDTEIEEKVGKLDRVNGHAWEITAQYAEEITCDAPNYVDRKCSLCGTTQSRVWHTPECTMSDYVYTKDYVYRVCLVCGTVESIYVSGNFENFDGCTTVVLEDGKYVLKGAHKDLVVKAGKEGTCETAGQELYIACNACGAVIADGKEIPAHNVTVIPAVAATCTAEGSTEGKYCEDCKTYIVEVKPVAKLAHTPVEVPAKAATATEAGHTAGKKCSVCGEVLEGMEPIAKLTATVKRLCTVRSLPADYRDNTESVVVEMLTADTAINILGVENEYYKVGEGRYIHISYVELAAAVA